MDQASHTALLTEGVEQIPLEHADQLQPGVLVSGASAIHVWQVLDAASHETEEDGWIRLRQLTRGVRLHSHQWTPRGEGSVECTVCGLRRQRISDLLPVRTPRAVIIIPPPGVVNAVAPYTLYATTSGQIVTVTIEGRVRTWSQPLPVIPYLHPVWTLPDALKELIKNDARTPHASREETPEGPVYTFVATPPTRTP